MSEKITYELIKEVREEQREMREDISSIKTTLQINTASLQDHIEGVKTLKELHRQNAMRIEKLEEEGKVNEAVKKKFVTYVGMLTTVLSLAAAWLKFKGII